jgi:Tfp pilus assembly protein PilO
VTGRDRIVVMVVLAVAAVVAGWMLVVSPKRSEASSLSSQIASEQSQLDSVRSQVDAGLAAQKAFAGQYAQLARLGEAVPPTDDIPSLIVQVQSAAQAAHVGFRGLQLTPGSSSSPATPSTSSGSSGSSSSTGAAPAAPLPPGAAVGPAGLPTENFTFTLSGSFFSLANFFNRLNNFVISRNSQLLISGRLMTINAINLSPGAAGSSRLSASVSATTYIVPSTQAPTPSTGSAGSAASATASAQPQTSGSSTAAPAATIAPVIR